MKAHWRREEPQFYNVHALAWERGHDLAVAQKVDARVLSSNELGSATLMADVPAGWRDRHSAIDGTLEIFVLEGALMLNGDGVGAGGFMFIPEGSGDSELCSGPGAKVLFYWTAQMPLEPDDAIRVTRVWQEPWQVQTMANMPHGAIAKSLRLPDVGDGPRHGGPGGMLRLILLPPGYADAQEHKHNCWEGLFFLAGDLFMPPRGVIGPGTYLGNPAEFWHAPMASQRGSLVLVQTDEPVVQPPRPYEGGQAMCNGYRDTASWLEQPAHTAWDDLPDYADAGEGVEWSDPTGAPS